MILIAFNVQYVTDSRRSHANAQMGIGLTGVLSFILVCFMLWMVRIAELAFFANRECVRRECGAELFAMLQAMQRGATLELSCVGTSTCYMRGRGAQRYKRNATSSGCAVAGRGKV